MKGAIRVSDLALVPADAHGCPGCSHVCAGPMISGSNNVFVNSLNAVRQGDPGIHAACCGPNTYQTSAGSGNVFVNGKPMVRFMDKTTHCGGNGYMITCSFNVFCN